MRALALACLLGMSGAAFGGPISKFNEKQPSLALNSPLKLEDVERCLIDMDSVYAPYVYRQPDRPDAVTIIWTSGAGASVGRVDLARAGSGTRVTSWLKMKQVEICASGQ